MTHGAPLVLGFAELFSSNICAGRIFSGEDSTEFSQRWKPQVAYIHGHNNLSTKDCCPYISFYGTELPVNGGIINVHSEISRQAPIWDILIIIRTGVFHRKMLRIRYLDSWFSNYYFKQRKKKYFFFQIIFYAFIKKLLYFKTKTVEWDFKW